MGSSQVISLANLLIISVMVLFGSLVMVINGAFSDNMYINWGSHHSWMQGSDLQLVLDQSSGKLISSEFLSSKNYIVYVNLTLYVYVVVKLSYVVGLNRVEVVTNACIRLDYLH